MRSIILLSMALIVITVAVYFQVGNHEFVTHDDPSYVIDNTHVSSGVTGNNIVWAFTSFHSANWHPVTWLSHMADAQLYGMNPRGHHLTSVAIHALSAALLLLLLYRLTGSLWQSLFVAALFALHPLHVESVAWVAERKDVLSGFFWFLTLILYAEYVKKRGERINSSLISHLSSALYLLTLFSFTLGLMSKPMLVTLPVVMLLMDYWPLCRFGNNAQGERLLRLIHLIKEKIPFFACSLLSSVVTIYAQRSVGALASLEKISFGSRIENALTAYVKYIGKTVWPQDLAVLYPIPPSFPFWQIIGSLLVLLVVSTITIRTRHTYPYLATGWFWYLGTLVPVIGIIQVGAQSMADRYTYIPHIGLFIIIAWGGTDLTKGWKYRKSVRALLAGAAITASITLTWQQLGYWQNSISLFRHALHVTPGKSMIHNYLGYAFLDKGRLDEAIQEFHEALRISPDYANAHFYLGLALMKKGNVGAAIQEYQEALRLKPDYFEAHTNLGVAFANSGDMDAALREYKEALQINPNDHVTHNNLGLVFARKRDLDAAIREFRETLRLKPNHSEAHNNLGFIFASSGNLDDAIQEFQAALRINPDDANAQNNLRLAIGQKNGAR